VSVPTPLLQPDSLPSPLDGTLTLRQVADLLLETYHRVEFIEYGELVIDGEPRTLRQIADALLETHRVEYVREGELIFMPPAAFTHFKIVGALTKFINRAFPSLTDVDWELGSENYQWDYRDGTGRFFVPDLAVGYPDANSRGEFRDDIELIVEVTSPKSKDTVANDREYKPKRYARGGVPLYLLVDQEQGTWTLHQLIEGWPKYQVASSGKYGEPIELPTPFGFAIPTDKWPTYSEDGE
jgi:Uma2 family endonuclease